MPCGLAAAFPSVGPSASCWSVSVYDKYLSGMRGKLFVLERYGRKDAYLKYLQTVILKTFRDDGSQPCWPGGDSGRTRRPLREVLEEGLKESLEVQEGGFDPTGFVVRSSRLEPKDALVWLGLDILVVGDFKWFTRQVLFGGVVWEGDRNELVVPVVWVQQQYCSNTAHIVLVASQRLKGCWVETSGNQVAYLAYFTSPWDPEVLTNIDSC